MNDFIGILTPYEWPVVSSSFVAHCQAINEIILNT